MDKPTDPMGLFALPGRIAAKIRVDEATGCWIWTGYISPNGYGKVSWHGKPASAHRLIYQLLVGPIPDGLTIDHVKERGCSSKACVKAVADAVGPPHLEAITVNENTRRAGLERWGETCRKGHKRTRGQGHCRTCRQEYERERRADPARRERQRAYNREQDRKRRAFGRSRRRPGPGQATIM